MKIFNDEQARVYKSHLRSEEAATAKRLKKAPVRDFLSFIDIFVSSDTESIAAGEREWPHPIEAALQDSRIVIVLRAARIRFAAPESTSKPVPRGSTNSSDTSLPFGPPAA